MLKSKKLCVIFGDQLSHQLSAIKQIDKKDDCILMMEVNDEASYVKHHQQKLIFVLSAMRHFAAELKDKGFIVKYIKLDSKDSKISLTKTLQRQIKQISASEIILTEPSEHRVISMVSTWEKQLGLPVTILSDDRYFCDHQTFNAWIKNKKKPRMEMFYREVRKKSGILMHNNEPVGGQWNYDKQNQKPTDSKYNIIKRKRHKPDRITQDVIKLVRIKFNNNYGSIDKFNYAVSRSQALLVLRHFITHCLATFGDYQDAMLTDDPFLHHSLISAYLNIGLLLPAEVCQAAEKAYHNKKAPINAVEGFIRQILGWREYIRGIYHNQMPKYAEKNYLNAKIPLPAFYWSSKTDMACMRQALEQTRDYAYSHHIQRLMITGNFALLIGVKPEDICDWYLAVYIDAFDWVELPNTLGMSMYADGGLLASKPYAASGNYINKMSNFCKQCPYNVKKRIGEDACPFNYLYWYFLYQHRTKLKNNMRLKFSYNNLARIDELEIKQINKQAKAFIEKISNEKDN